VVSGVVADFPQNSTINFEMLVPINSIRTWDILSGDWSRYIFQTYIQIQPGVSLKSVEQQLISIHHKNQPLANVTDGDYHLQPLSDIHLYAPDGSASGFQTVRAFFIVAILILLLASVNYVNLSTARAMLRAKEVSVRKVLGAGKIQLYTQFFVETLLFFFISFSLAILLIQLIMPLYNEISGKQMQFDMLNFSVLKVALFTLIFTMVASGIYPMLLLSSFNPVNALKGKISMGIGSSALKKVLIVGQFSFAIVLIIGTLIINKQLEFIRNKELGYDKTHVFSLNMANIRDHYDAVKAELLSHAQITAVTSGTNSIVDNDFTTSDTEWDGKDNDRTFLVHVLEIDKDFLNFFKLNLSGTNFTGSKSDTAHYILNETAVKEAGIINPIGKRFMVNHSSVSGVIIGVVKDFNFISLKQKVAPLILTYSNQNRILYIKTKGRNAGAAISVANGIWKRYNGDRPFDYSFLDEEYNSLYKSYQQTGKLFNIFAGISIFISCLGLFGLATYTAQVKIKEIGIRKVLGANVGNITMMLSAEFLKLVFIAILIATPVAWYLMNKYLEDFAYRATISWWTFSIAAFITLIIALVTVSFQSLKAALSNPVNSLRSE
jgi:putative ABC transport system permease protein